MAKQWRALVLLIKNKKRVVKKDAMKKILTIGSSMQDIFTQYDHVETLQLHTKNEDASYVIMRAGRKIEVKQLSYYCGGGATNSAVSFARAGFAVESFFKIGSDRAGEFIVQTLAAENVNTQHVLKTDAVPTGTSFIVPGPHGNGSVLVYRGANLTLTASEIPEKAISECDQLYITSLSGATAELLAPITACAKKYGKQVAANPGTSQLNAGPQFIASALPHIDILIVNSYEAQVLMTSLTTSMPECTISAQGKGELPDLLKKPLGFSSACFTLFQFFHEVHSRGPRIVVVTNGAEGVYVSDGSIVYFHPSIKTDMISSTGAGDAFGSSFVARLLTHKSIEDALRMGVVNSSSVINYLGTQTGLLSADELIHAAQQLDQSLVKKYTLV